MPPQRFQEHTVLRARKPTLVNSDDWPEFVLDRAHVTLPNGKSEDAVSLLLAHEQYPLCVTGSLESPPPEDQIHLWQPRFRPTAPIRPKQRREPSHIDIEIPEVRSFAYGAYPNGDVEIWAAGKAGWFVLRPSPEYRHIYEEMIEAVNVLYFITDAYESHSNAKMLSARQIFVRYSRDIDGDAEDAAARIYKHREFLLCSMMDRQKVLEWETRPIYKHLLHKFPKDVHRIRKRWAEGETEQIAEAAPTKLETNSQEVESNSGSLKRKRGRPRETADTEVVPLRSTSVADSEVEENPFTGRKNNTKSHGHQSGPSALASEVQPLRHRLQRGRTEPQSYVSRAAKSPSTPTQDSDSDRAGFQLKTKSALRLKPTKPMKGLPMGAAKGGKGTNAHHSSFRHSDDDSADDSAQHPVQLLPNKREPQEGLPVALRPRSKRRAGGRRQQDLDEGIDMPSSPSNASDGGGDDGGGVHQLSPDPDLQMARPDPLQEDTWICALDGCAHKVYTASDPEAQALIREHYALHAYDDDQRVQLVRTLQAPSLPVRHLLERVKMQARSDGIPGSAVAGTRFPDPLRRKF